MKRPSSPQPAAAPETEQPSLPAELIALAPETAVDTAAAPAPYEIPERRDDRHYTDHWGINE